MGFQITADSLLIGGGLLVICIAIFYLWFRKEKKYIPDNNNYEDTRKRD